MNREIDKIILHCSDSSDSIDIGFDEINDWHAARGWKSAQTGISCGYHYVIRRNGLIERGRDDSEVGAHVKGHNTGSIGICWVGRNDISEKQQTSLLTIVRHLMFQHDLTLDDVYGHCELFPGKTCPNLDMNHFRAELVFV